MASESFEIGWHFFVLLRKKCNPDHSQRSVMPIHGSKHLGAIELFDGVLLAVVIDHRDFGVTVMFGGYKGVYVLSSWQCCKITRLSGLFFIARAGCCLELYRKNA